VEFIEAMQQRRSIRVYKPTPVSKEILTEVLEVATRAPSGGNQQPWEFTVLGGKVLDELREALQKQFLSGVESHPHFAREPVVGLSRERYIANIVPLYQTLGIGREDKEKRTQYSAQMMRFLDAPNAIIISTEKQDNPFLTTFSIGAVTQSIALAAVNLGLGTCILHIVTDYPEVISRIAGIPGSKRIAIGIAIGYPDWAAAVNKFRSARVPLSEVVSWRGI
jgi:nitroreductase